MLRHLKAVAVVTMVVCTFTQFGSLQRPDRPAMAVVGEIGQTNSLHIAAFFQVVLPFASASNESELSF
jgi:hypothetical protein